MSNNLDPKKFVLVQNESILYDEQMKTKSIGYYRDAFNRFKKNKASVVAAIILIFIMLMSLVGPLVNDYSLKDDATKWSTRLKDMPPKIPGLEWMSLFDGTKVLTGETQNFSNLPEGIVLEVLGVNTIGQITVRVDYYAYINHKYSKEIDPLTQNFMSSAYSSLTTQEYDAVKAYELATGETVILEDAAILNGSYRVRVDYFKFLEAVYGVDKVEFWFGSTGQGDDLFTVLFEGARVSLLLAFSVAIINILIGVVVGSISGYYGGTIDLVIERLSEILSGLPFLAILTLLILRFGSDWFVVLFAFTLTGWLGTASVTRTQFYRYKNREYVLAARTLGAGDVRIMAKHIFPNILGTLITSVVLYVPGIIFSESTFSYLGIINYDGVTSVGTLLANGQSVMKDSFNQILFPAIFISLLMLSFNLFGNGLRDAFNPSLRGVEE